LGESEGYRKLMGLPPLDESQDSRWAIAAARDAAQEDADFGEWHGVKISEWTEAWSREDGGVYVGRGDNVLTCSIFQERFWAELEVAEVQMALKGRTLYVKKGEEVLARELVDYFKITIGKCMDLAAWHEVAHGLLKDGVTVCSMGVIVKLLLRLRPGALGTFARLLPCCAMKTFKRTPVELLPMKLPGDTEAEASLMISMIGTPLLGEREGLPEVDKRQAGIDAWVWLQTLLLNFMFCGGKRLLGSVMAHPAVHSPAQKKVLERLLSQAKIFCEDNSAVPDGPWHKVSENLGGIFTRARKWSRPTSSAGWPLKARFHRRAQELELTWQRSSQRSCDLMCWTLRC
jgi:hypothetical protein